METKCANHFCKHAECATETTKPIGDWFDQHYASGISWDNATPAEVSLCTTAEDYLVSRLLELHELPTAPRQCEYTINQLARAVAPEIQADLWNSLVEKFS